MFHKLFPLFIVITIVVLIVTALTSTKQAFLLRTGQHDINKMGLTGEYDNNLKLASFEKSTFPVPLEIFSIKTLSSVLGDNLLDSKRIEIDLSNQKMYAYEHNKLVFDYTISTGNPWTATPPGEYRTWIKLRYTKMEGGSRALGTYYNLPNVPNVMYFYNNKVAKWQGYGIHGAYWHNNFGNPMSHGCVNMKLGNAAEIFDWAGVGTRVIIYGSTPLS